MELVSQVDSVRLFSFPPLGVAAGVFDKIFVFAVGRVTSSGWTQAGLSPVYTAVPPADGVWDFRFIADPPAGPILPVELPIIAFGMFSRPDWFQGVRVHARNNEVEILEVQAIEQMELPEPPNSLFIAQPDGVIVSHQLAIFDDSFQPIGFCSWKSVKMKKLRHELTLVVTGPDEAKIRDCIAKALGAGLIAAIIVTFPTGGGGLAAALSAFLGYLENCLGSAFQVRIDNRSHWIEWCT